MRAPLAAAGAAATAATAAWSLPALAPVVPPLCDALGVDRTFAGGPDAVALTFDDGPHAQGTPAVLDALAAAGASATFFLVGEQVRRHPGLAAEIAAAGHTIALHGDRHRNLLRVPPPAVADDLDRGRDAIAAATGITATLHRPPYGIFSPAALVLVRRRGLHPLLWSRWGHDWRRRATPDGIADEVTEDLAPGDVLLLHDADHYSAAGSWRRTALALPIVLERIRHRGLRAVAL